MYDFGGIGKMFICCLLLNKKKNSKIKEKNFFNFVKSYLKDDCDNCKKLEKKEEFKVKTVPD